MKLWSNTTIPGSGSFVPEKRLLAAVLQRAVADFVGGEDDMRKEAGGWLFDNSDSDDSDESSPPLTFTFICEALDLDIDTLRKAIAAQGGVSEAAFTTHKIAV